jgi:hypothetical protein
MRVIAEVPSAVTASYARIGAQAGGIVGPIRTHFPFFEHRPYG